MHPNAQLLRGFYEAFALKDAKVMANCYHEEATFSDPVFPILNSTQVKAMWAMLCERGKDLQLTFRDVEADDVQGKCHWEATYTFSQTKRKVHNIIEAEFKFKDGKIVYHKDNFDFYRWSRMALGLPGILLGWTPIIKNKVRQLAFLGLKRFMERPAQS